MSNNYRRQYNNNNNNNITRDRRRSDSTNRSSAIERDRRQSDAEPPKSMPRSKAIVISRTVPGFGEPGGPDDPLRNGLSGAGVKWYLRYLQRGLSPQEARRNASDRRKQDSMEKRNLRSSSSQQSQHERDRRRSVDARRPIRNNTKTNERDDGKSIRIAILPARKTDENRLTANQLVTLEETLVTEISHGWQSKLKFNGIYFRDNMLIIDCVDRSTAEWLEKLVPKMRSWQGVALTTRTGDEIPRQHTISMYLPRSGGQQPKQTLALLNAQNNGLNIEKWKVLSCAEERNGQFFTVGIDTKSLRTIETQGNLLNYRFGKIRVFECRPPAFDIPVIEMASTSESWIKCEPNATGDDDDDDEDMPDDVDEPAETGRFKNSHNVKIENELK